MTKRIIILIILVSLTVGLYAQYPPAAGQTGTTAMYKDSSAFVAWASACTVQRGFQNIADTSLGFVTVGDSSMATGPAGPGGVVSLGDGGIAILTFDEPIANGPGWDFAVFENSFDGLFLELAFVEVSSDGINFFRFPPTSLTDTATQIGTFGTIDATKINNLAGKYSLNYGTPFDLQELDSIAGLDISAVTHIKIIDVVGSMTDSLATRDSAGNKINDPWPTPFAQGGFDLDAVGVIHKQPQSVEEFKNIQINVFPNPASDDIRFAVPSHESERNTMVHISDLAGRRLISQVLTAESVSSDTYKMDITGLSDGCYLLSAQNGTSYYHSTFIIRH